MKILFSDKEDWKGTIKSGFKDTQHEIAFGEFSPDKIKEYDLVVPLTIPDLKRLHEDRIPIVDNPIPIPSLASIVLCNDKLLLNQMLIAKGFGSLVPNMGGTLTYPYILKKRIDQCGMNSRIVTSTQEKEALPDVLDHPGYFAQEVIVGAHEYATHILFKDQKVLCALNVEYAFGTETPIKGRDKAIYVKKCDCSYLDLFSAVLIAIGFEGLCCINYKVRDNAPVIFEINPRFGGSLCPFFSSFVTYLEDKEVMTGGGVMARRARALIRAAARFAGVRLRSRGVAPG